MKKFLILAFLFVLACGAHAETVNLLQNGDFSYDDEEACWLRFEDSGTPSEWNIENGTANFIANSSGKCGAMYYQVVKAPVGATVSVEADWMSDMAGDTGFWAEVFFGTVEDAFALDSMWTAKIAPEWTVVESFYSKPGTLWAPSARLSYTCPNSYFYDYSNNGEGGIAYKKDGWGMNQPTDRIDWEWQSCNLSTNVPVAESEDGWNQGKLGRPTFTSVESRGDVFVILKLGGTCGTPGGGVHFDNVEINIDSADLLPGDLNCDGSVNSADLDIVRANWGSSVSPGCIGWGDPTGDGVVNSSDLDVVRANWGRTAAANAVPEPATLCLLAISALAMLFVRRR